MRDWQIHASRLYAQPSSIRFAQPVRRWVPRGVDLNEPPRGTAADKIIVGLCLVAFPILWVLGAFDPPKQAVRVAPPTAVSVPK